MTPSALPTIHVEFDAHGHWDVDVSEPESHATCESLDAARRLAYRTAAERRPCELVVRDAYHRVVWRELLTESPEPDPAATGLGTEGE